MFLADEEDNRSDQEQSGRQEERKVETNVLLGVDHRNLTDERTAVDHEVEIEEDASVGNCRIDNNAFTRLLDGHYSESSILNLFCKERGNVGLEESGADTKGNETDDEGSHGGLGVFED